MDLNIVLELYAKFYDYTDEKLKYIVKALTSLNNPYNLTATMSKGASPSYLCGLKLKDNNSNNSKVSVKPSALSALTASMESEKEEDAAASVESRKAAAYQYYFALRVLVKQLKGLLWTVEQQQQEQRG